MLTLGERAPAPPAPGRLHGARVGAEAVAAFLALLVPTLLFKYVFVLALTFGDLTVLQPVEAGAPAATGWLLAAHVFPADVLETAILTGLVLGGLRLFRVPPLRGIVLVTGLAIAAGAAELLALDELGALVTLETLRAAVWWSVGSLAVVPAFVTPRRLLFLLIGAAWLLTPVVLVRLQGRLARTHPRAALAAPLALLAVQLFAAVRAPGTLLPTREASPFARPFWRSAVLSLIHRDGAPRASAATASRAAVRTAYERLAYPDSEPPAPGGPWLVDVPPHLRTPRHIVIVSLETAPAAYYDFEAPGLATLQRMQAHAVVAGAHQTTAPLSNAALFSILDGAYPRPGAPAVRSGPFAPDSLPRLLGPRGYETTYIDSYDIDWNGPEDRQMLEALGFDTLLDATSERLPPQPDAYARRLARDRRSLELARDRVIAAAARGRYALVTVVTHLGHFAWPDPPAERPLSGRETLAALLRALDGLLGEFLAGIEDAALADDLILVVTGDHGLRFRAEFEALGEPLVYGDATFHVPLLIYAPGLFASQARVTYVTSHVDLAPTLLDLTGTPRDGALLHGDNLLDPRVARRITFLPSGVYPGLRPVDGFHWRGRVYSRHEITGVVSSRSPGEDAVQPAMRADPGPPLSDAEVRAILDRSRQLFSDTAAVLLEAARPDEAARSDGST